MDGLCIVSNHLSLRQSWNLASATTWRPDLLADEKFTLISQQLTQGLTALTACLTAESPQVFEAGWLLLDVQSNEGVGGWAVS